MTAVWGPRPATSFVRLPFSPLQQCSQISFPSHQPVHIWCISAYKVIGNADTKHIILVQKVCTCKLTYFNSICLEITAVKKLIPIDYCPCILCWVVIIIAGSSKIDIWFLSLWQWWQNMVAGHQQHLILAINSKLRNKPWAFMLFAKRILLILHVGEWQKAAM